MNLIYKQLLLPICEYADLMVESGPMDKVAQLHTLQIRALRIIDNRNHPNLDSDVLSNLYRIASLKLCRAEHLSLILYRLSKHGCYTEKTRPDVHLRSRNKLDLSDMRGSMRNS